MKKQEIRQDVTVEVQEIKGLLERFQQGYIKRDKNIIDDYMKDIFEHGNDVVILGTSEREWCLGYDDAKELVESDWEYWGDVRVDTENAIITVKSNTAWVAVHGTVKYEFLDSEERYSKYVELVKSYFEEESDFSKLTLKEKFTYIEWSLTHISWHSKPGVSTNYYPLRLTGVLVKNNGKWRFKYMQFSLPIPSYPEIRIDNVEDYRNANYEEIQKIKAYVDSHNKPEFSEIREVLSSFETDYLCKNEKSSEDLIQKYFVAKDNIMLIDTSDVWRKGADEIKDAIESYRKVWNKIELEKDLEVIGIEGEIAWLAVEGIASIKITEDEAMIKEVENIKSNFDLNIPSRDKLFRISRDISRMFLETVKGEEFLWPFRLEVILLKESNRWKFYNMQFSYPFNYILEDKYDLSNLDCILFVGRSNATSTKL